MEKHQQESIRLGRSVRLSYKSHKLHHLQTYDTMFLHTLLAAPLAIDVAPQVNRFGGTRNDRIVTYRDADCSGHCEWLV
jgi:hypothetical protein